MHFRAKHKFLDFRKQTLNEPICYMCNKVNTHESLLVVRSRFSFHMHDLVHFLSMESKLHYFNAHYFSEPFSECFETARECTLTKRNLACGMITINESTTPLTLFRQWILSAIVRSKSIRIFIPQNNSDL